MYAGQGMPGADVAGELLPVGTKMIAMTKEESLVLQNRASHRCRSRCSGRIPCPLVAVRAIRRVAPDAAKRRRARSARGKLPIAGKCGMYEDVLDCVPATAVDAEGNVGGEYSPMQRLLQAGGDAPAK